MKPFAIALLAALLFASPLAAQEVPAEPPPDPAGMFLTGPACGLAQAAFCETFNQPATISTRSGQLDPVIWGVSRTTGDVSLGNRSNAWSPTVLQGCSGAVTVTPPGDVVICNGQLREASNDGTNVTTLAMYPKQPFDFAGRTGIVTFDVSNDTQGNHAAWPEFWITDLPIPAPFTHEASWIAVPRNGFGLRFAGFADSSGNPAQCPGGSPAYVGVDSAITINNYVPNDSFAGGSLRVHGTSCVKAATSPDQLNHYEIHVSQTQIDIYGTDAGTTAPLKHLATIPNANLGFTRGLVWIEDSHYNGNKFNSQREHTFAWDNVGFDGPFTYRDLAFDALDNTTTNADGTINLGKFSGAGQSASWDVLAMPATPVATAVRVLFNFFPNAIPKTLDVGVNGHQHLVPWPYPDVVANSWRTFAVTIPIAELVPGTNVVTIGGDQPMVSANVDIVLVDAGAAVTTPTAVPTPAATSTDVPTATAQPTATEAPTIAPAVATPTSMPTATIIPAPVSTVTCFVVTMHNGVLEQDPRPESFCGAQ